MKNLILLKKKLRFLFDAPERKNETPFSPSRRDFVRAFFVGLATTTLPIKWITRGDERFCQLVRIDYTRPMSQEEYREEYHQWLDSRRFEGLNDEFLRDGRLLELHNITKSNTAYHLYIFKDIKAQQMWDNELVGRMLVNFNAIGERGHKFSVQHFHYPSNESAQSLITRLTS